MTGRPRTPAHQVDCQHAKAHEHGTVAAYKNDQCRCEACRAACAANWRMRSRAKAYGQFQPGFADPQGAMRRLQALAAIGWSAQSIRKATGLWPDTLQRVRNGGRNRITPELDQRIRAVYEQLWNQPPPQANRHEKGAVTRAKRYAARHSWVPPLAWDDIDTDWNPALGEEVDVDEIAVERAARGERLPLTRTERDEVERIIQARREGLAA